MPIKTSLSLVKLSFVLCVFQVLKLKGEFQYRKTLITNNGSPTGAGSPMGIAVDPARGYGHLNQLKPLYFFSFSTIILNVLMETENIKFKAVL